MVSYLCKNGSYRENHFMQNLFAQAENIIKDGVVYSASGDGKIPFIDTRDIAAVAVVTLTQPGHLGKKYVITGSEAISYRQATEIIGAAIGKRLRYIDESFDEARARLMQAGQSSWLIESSLALAAYQRAGGPTETINSVVADLTGKPPRLHLRGVRSDNFGFCGLRSAIGFRDMVGGVGFILGGFGLWAFIAARRGRK